MNLPPTDPSQPSPHNPFATRYIRPGAIPLFFLPGESLESLQANWLQAGGWGQIVGPHGTGKSTLLHGWARTLQQADQSVISLQFNAERPLPRHDLELDWSTLSPQTTLACDGWEQLSWLRRRRFLQRIRQRGARLIVTGHRDFGLPWTYRTSPDLERVQQIVAWLQRQLEPLVQDDDTATAFANAQGNVRETLLALYDVYRERSARSRHDDSGK